MPEFDRHDHEWAYEGRKRLDEIDAFSEIASNTLGAPSEAPSDDALAAYHELGGRPVKQANSAASGLSAESLGSFSSGSISDIADDIEKPSSKIALLQDNHKTSPSSFTLSPRQDNFLKHTAADPQFMNAFKSVGRAEGQDTNQSGFLRPVGLSNNESARPDVRKSAFRDLPGFKDRFADVDVSENPDRIVYPTERQVHARSVRTNMTRRAPSVREHAPIASKSHQRTLQLGQPLGTGEGLIFDLGHVALRSKVVRQENSAQDAFNAPLSAEAIAHKGLVRDLSDSEISSFDPVRAPIGGKSFIDAQKRGQGLVGTFSSFKADDLIKPRCVIKAASKSSISQASPSQTHPAQHRQTPAQEFVSSAPPVPSSDLLHVKPDFHQTNSQRSALSATYEAPSSQNVISEPTAHHSASQSRDVSFLTPLGSRSSSSRQSLTRGADGGMMSDKQAVLTPRDSAPYHVQDARAKASVSTHIDKKHEKYARDVLMHDKASLARTQANSANQRLEAFRRAAAQASKEDATKTSHTGVEENLIVPAHHASISSPSAKIAMRSAHIPVAHKDDDFSPDFALGLAVITLPVVDDTLASENLDTLVQAHDLMSLQTFNENMISRASEGAENRTSPHLNTTHQTDISEGAIASQQEDIKGVKVQPFLTSLDALYGSLLQRLSPSAQQTAFKQLRRSARWLSTLPVAHTAAAAFVGLISFILLMYVLTGSSSARSMGSVQPFDVWVTDVFTPLRQALGSPG